MQKKHQKKQRKNQRKKQRKNLQKKKKSKPISQKEMSEIENEEESKPSQGNEENVVATSSKFTLITVKLSCDSKCGYKKTLKRSKTFVPKEKDLKCPKCGKQMKIKK